MDGFELFFLLFRLLQSQKMVMLLYGISRKAKSMLKWAGILQTKSSICINEFDSEELKANPNDLKYLPSLILLALLR